MRLRDTCLEVDDRHFGSAVGEKINQTAPNVAAEIGRIPNQERTGAQRGSCPAPCRSDDGTLRCGWFNIEFTAELIEGDDDAIA
jgi:hypothetical protein